MTVDKEEVKVRGTELAGKAKQVIHEGNVRRIIVKDSRGHTMMEFPVTVGVVAVFTAPVLTAAAALAAIAAEWTVKIERHVPDMKPVRAPADVKDAPKDRRKAPAA